MECAHHRPVTCEGREWRQEVDRLYRSSKISWIGREEAVWHNKKLSQVNYPIAAVFSLEG